jgi:hypothetical protein
MSQQDCEELVKLQGELTKVRKTIGDNKKIPPKLKPRLDEMQKKIHLLRLACAATPPKFPEGMAGDVDYQGIPERMLTSDKDKKNAKARAKYVRDHLQTIAEAAKRLEEASKKYNEKRKSYESTMSDMQGVLKNFETDLQKGSFNKLSKKSKQEVDKALRGFETASHEIKEKTTRREGQAWKLASAQAMVQKAEMILDSYDLAKQKGTAEKEKAAVEKELKQLEGFVGFVVGNVGNPLAGAKKFGVELLETMAKSMLVDLLGGDRYKQRIKEIEERIKRIEQRLDELHLATLKADLNGAVAMVKAVEKDTEAVRNELRKVKENQVAAINLLANVEKGNPNTTSTFGELQKYFSKVQTVGAETLKVSREYQDALEKADAAIPYLDNIYDIVETDKTFIEGINRNRNVGDIEILGEKMDAKAIGDYLKKMDRWFSSRQIDRELEAQHLLQHGLLLNDHYAYIEGLINDIQEAGLGDVPDQLTE